jgi:hypothetical protein
VSYFRNLVILKFLAYTITQSLTLIHPFLRSRFDLRSFPFLLSAPPFDK